MVNFICQLGWVVVPIHVVKHSECFCKWVFGRDDHLNWWTLSKQTVLPNVVGLVQWVEGLSRKNDWLPLSKSKFCNRRLSDWNCNTGSLSSLRPDCLWTWMATSAYPWVCSLPAHPADFGLASLHSHGSQFLNVNVSLQIYTSYWFCFSVQL